MQMDEGMDTGDVLLREETPIAPNETTAELWDRLANMGANLLVKTLENLDTIEPVVQDHDAATYAPLITKDLGRIDWNNTATTLHNLVRGCVSWPVAHCAFRGQTMKIWRSQVVDHTEDAEVGTIVRTKPYPVVATTSGGLELLEIQLPGKKRCDATALVNGFQLDVGESLNFPPDES